MQIVVIIFKKKRRIDDISEAIFIDSDPATLLNPTIETKVTNSTEESD